MLAKCLPGLLPDLTADEAIEVTKLHSVRGTLAPGTGLMHTRPFRSPHHTVSDVALVGGGRTPQPGELSLAHHGVLFLDELPEFPRSALEALRQPLEDGSVQVTRQGGTAVFPAQVLLVAAMNPCPCGNWGSADIECVCTAAAVRRYRAKVSGPLIDRFDMHVEVPRVPLDRLEEQAVVREAEGVLARVSCARRLQAPDRA